MLVLCLFIVLAALFITAFNSKAGQQMTIGGQAVNTFSNLTGSSPKSRTTDKKEIADPPPA